MTPATAGADVREYLEAVRARLADLPSEEREHLMSDSETSLLAAAEEDEGGSLTARLGPPERFADELRAAAGLAPPAPPAATAPGASLRALLDHPRVRAAGEVARELAPVWWLARAYVLAGILVVFGAGAFSTMQPTLPLVLPGVLGLAFLLALAAGSVWLGRRERRGRIRPAGVVAINLVLIAAALPVAERVISPGYSGTAEPAVYAGPIPADGLTYDGRQLRNIYPYSRDGKLLLDVLLYDENGEPLDIGDRPDPLRRTLSTADGRELLNAFPIRYYEHGTRRVARPNAGPDVSPPRIVTPPLRR